MVLMAAAGLLAVVIVAIELRDWRRRKSKAGAGASPLVSEPKPLTKAEAQARSARREGTKKTSRGTANVPAIAAPVAKAAEVREAAPAAPARPVTAVAAAAMAAPVAEAPKRAEPPKKQQVRGVAVQVASSVQGAVKPRAFMRPERDEEEESRGKSAPVVKDIPVVKQEPAAPAVQDVEAVYDFTRSARMWRPLSKREQHEMPEFEDVPVMDSRQQPVILGQGDESPEELAAIHARHEAESKRIEKDAVNSMLAMRSARKMAVDPQHDHDGDARVPEIRSGVRALSQRQSPLPMPADAATLASSERMAAAIAASVAKISGMPAPKPAAPPVVEAPAAKPRTATRPVVAVEPEASPFDEPEGAEALVAAAMAGAPALEDDSAEDDSSGTETWVAKVTGKVPKQEQEQDEDGEPVVAFHAELPAVDMSARVRQVENEGESLSDAVIGGEGEESGDVGGFDLIAVGRASARIQRARAEIEARQRAAEAEVDEDQFDLHRQPLRIVRDSGELSLEAGIPLVSDRMIAAQDDDVVARASDSMIVPVVEDVPEVEDVPAVAALADDEETATRRTRAVDIEEVAPIPTSQRVMIGNDEVITDDTPVNMAVDASDEGEEEEVDIYMDLNSESMRAPMVELEPSMIDDVHVVVPPDLLEPGMGEDDEEETATQSRRGRRSARSGRG